MKQFAGPDWEISVAPPPARNLMTRFDEKAQHYEVLERGPHRKAELEMSLTTLQLASVGLVGPREG